MFEDLVGLWVGFFWRVLYTDYILTSAGKVVAGFLSSVEIAYWCCSIDTLHSRQLDIKIGKGSLSQK